MFQLAKLILAWLRELLSRFRPIGQPVLFVGIGVEVDGVREVLTGHLSGRLAEQPVLLGSELKKNSDPK